jgi:hypothetical protein
VAILLPFVVLPLCVALFSWIEQTVLPSAWETGELFGLYPSAGERLLQKAANWSAVACGAMWWVLVASIVTSAVTT